MMDGSSSDHNIGADNNQVTEVISTGVLKQNMNDDGSLEVMDTRGSNGNGASGNIETTSDVVIAVENVNVGDLELNKNNQLAFHVNWRAVNASHPCCTISEEVLKKSFKETGNASHPCCTRL